MIISNAEGSLNLVKNFATSKDLLIPILTSKWNKNVELELTSSFDWLPNLLNLQVTKLSKFHQNIWDYNEDYLNPPRSVQGTKLQINFNDYPLIPPMVVLELKCLLHICYILPSAFRKSKGKRKRVYSEIKPNTVLSHFKAGCRYLNEVFDDLNYLGKEFVSNRFKTLTDILDGDFRKSAKNFEYSSLTELKIFLKYLTHPFTENILGSSVKVDFESMEWPKFEKNKRLEKKYFSNDDFEKLIHHSTFKVVGFLTRISKEVEDQTALKYSDSFNESDELGFKFDSSLLNDYTVLRLWSRGYSQEYISSKFYISKDICNKNGGLLIHENIREILKGKYKVESFDSVRKYINEVYYASAFLIAQLTGMRPEELSEIKISNSLSIHNGFDVIVSNVKKNDFENLELFDDKWVVIRIMKDAMHAAEVISNIKNNDYLFSNMNTVSPDKCEASMDPSGIKHFIDNYLKVVLGKKHTKSIKFNSYMFRHSLAYQLHRIELGLPFISFQLKHVVDNIGKYTSFGSASETTLGYGEIAENIIANNDMNKSIRRDAEIERIKSTMDPNGIYVGANAEEHKSRLKKVFQGYMAEGYSEDDIFNAMAEQGMAIINVGTGFCFGGVESFDENIPCIGTLRCNPLRCKNAIIGKANIPKWKEVLISNKSLIGKDGYEERETQLLEAVKEAEQVLIYLGVPVT